MASTKNPTPDRDRSFTRDLVQAHEGSLQTRLFEAPRTLGTIVAMQALGMKFSSPPDGNIH
jgi:hypothetical protein